MVSIDKIWHKKELNAMEQREMALSETNKSSRKDNQENLIVNNNEIKNQ